MHDHDLTPAGGRRLPRPTRGALAVVPAAIAVEIVGRLLASNWVTMAAAGLIGALVGSALLTTDPRAVVVARSAPLRMRAGEPATVRLHVSNPRRWRGAGPFLLVDKAPGLPDAAVFVGRLAPGAAAVAEIVRTPVQRGRWTAPGTVTVDARSALGGFTRRRTWTWAEPTLVHPALADPGRPTSAGSSPLTGSARGAGSAGRGSEVLGLRDWRPGDAAAAVHWRTSARRGYLSVLDRERPAPDDLIVALGRPGEGPAWELAVSRGAATAAAAYRDGTRVTLVTGAGVTVPSSMTALLDWFADVESGPVASGSQVLRLASGGDARVVWLAGEGPPC